MLMEQQYFLPNTPKNATPLHLFSKNLLADNGLQKFV